MSSATTIPERVEAALTRLSDRERVLLAIMVVVLSLMATTLGVYLIGGRINSLEEGVEARRDALGTLLAHSEDYIRNSEYNTRLRQQLANNDVRLSTFIEGRASRASIPRPREFRDNTQVLDGGITMLTTTADFAAIELEQLERLLTSVEESDELVFTRQVGISPARRGAAGIDLEVTLATFRQGGEQ